MLLIGATIWTVIIKKAQSVNDITVGQTGSPVSLGVDVTIGSGLYLAWAGFATLLASIIPYMITQVLHNYPPLPHRLLTYSQLLYIPWIVLLLMQAVSHDFDPLAQEFG